MSLPLQDCFGAPWYHLGSVGVIHTFLVWASLFYKSSPDLLTLDSPLCLDSPLASLSDSLHLHLFRSLFLSLSCSSYLPSLLSYPLLSSPLLSLSLSLLLVTHLSAYAPLALSLSLALSLTLSSFSLFPPLSHSLSLCTLARRVCILHTFSALMWLFGSCLNYLCTLCRISHLWFISQGYILFCDFSIVLKYYLLWHTKLLKFGSDVVRTQF